MQRKRSSHPCKMQRMPVKCCRKLTCCWCCFSLPLSLFRLDAVNVFCFFLPSYRCFILMSQLFIALNHLVVFKSNLSLRFTFCHTEMDTHTAKLIRRVHDETESRARQTSESKNAFKIYPFKRFFKQILHHFIHIQTQLCY